MSELAAEETRVADEMRLQQVQPAAMYCHRRSVRKLDSVLDVHLENAVLGFRIPAVRLQHHVYGCAENAIIVS